MDYENDVEQWLGFLFKVLIVPNNKKCVKAIIVQADFASEIRFVFPLLET